MNGYSTINITQFIMIWHVEHIPNNLLRNNRFGASEHAILEQDSCQITVIDGTCLIMLHHTHKTRKQEKT